jgi:hypothetical protein
VAGGEQQEKEPVEMPDLPDISPAREAPLEQKEEKMETRTDKPTYTVKELAELLNCRPIDVGNAKHNRTASPESRTGAVLVAMRERGISWDQVVSAHKAGKGRTRQKAEASAARLEAEALAVETEPAPESEPEAEYESEPESQSFVPEEDMSMDDIRQQGAPAPEVADDACRHTLQEIPLGKAPIQALLAQIRHCLPNAKITIEIEIPSSFDLEMRGKYDAKKDHQDLGQKRPRISRGKGST